LVDLGFFYFEVKIDASRFVFVPIKYVNFCVPIGVFTWGLAQNSGEFVQK